MRAHTTSITIASSRDHVFAYLADGEKLPVWAIGFAKAIERTDDAWIVTLASGDRMGLRIDSDAATGVIDYVSLPTPGGEAPAHTRVVEHGSSSVYTFTMHQADGLSDETFDAQIAELARELQVLKAHLETACPL